MLLSDMTTYQVVEPKNILGCGAFSEVLEGIDSKRKTPVAIKAVDVSETASLVEVQKEIFVHSQVRHPNLVPLLHASLCPGSGDENQEEKLFLVMPKYRCSIATLLRRKFPNGIKDPVILATIIKKTLLALEYLHSNNVMHRDIKGGNILLADDGKVALSDFGVSKLLNNPFQRPSLTRAKTFVGTPCWMAPEVMEQQGGYDCPADIWSLGITAMELAYGRAPYAKYPPVKVLIQTLQEPPPTTVFYEEKGCSIAKSFGKFVQTIMKKNPVERPTVNKLLRHKFITKYAAKDEECDAVVMRLLTEK